jgi:ribosomal protein S18 acetylase RimI-like enzyme
VAIILSKTPTSDHPGAPPKFSCRPAFPDDYPFAIDLYLSGAKHLLIALGEWHEERVLARFKQGFKLEQSQVIQSDGADIGWMQVSETPQQIHLHQLHIVARYRNLGIGTQVIQALIERARHAGQAVVLNVIRGNPASALYRRLGFRVVAGNAEKLHMRREAERPEHP